MFDDVPQTAEEASDELVGLRLKRGRGRDVRARIEAMARLRDWLRLRERVAA